MSYELGALPSTILARAQRLAQNVAARQSVAAARPDSWTAKVAQRMAQRPAGFSRPAVPQLVATFRAAATGTRRILGRGAGQRFAEAVSRVRAGRAPFQPIPPGGPVTTTTMPVFPGNTAASTSAAASTVATQPMAPGMLPEPAIVDRGGGGGTTPVSPVSADPGATATDGPSVPPLALIAGGAAVLWFLSRRRRAA